MSKVTTDALHTILEAGVKSPIVKAHIYNCRLSTLTTDEMVYSLADVLIGVVSDMTNELILMHERSVAPIAVCVKCAKDLHIKYE